MKMCKIIYRPPPLKSILYTRESLMFIFVRYGNHSGRMSEEEKLRNMVVKVNESSFVGTVGTESSESSRSMTTGGTYSFSTDLSTFTQRDSSSILIATETSFISQISKTLKNILPSLVSRPVYARPYSTSSQDESAHSIRSLRDQMKDTYSRYDDSNTESRSSKDTAF